MIDVGLQFIVFVGEGFCDISNGAGDFPIFVTEFTDGIIRPFCQLAGEIWPGAGMLLVGDTFDRDTANDSI